MMELPDLSSPQSQDIDQPETEQAPQLAEKNPDARVRIQLDVPHGARVRIKVSSGTKEARGKPQVRVERLADPSRPVGRSAAWLMKLTPRMPRLFSWLRSQPGQIWLFVGALLVYLAVRLIRLPEFPIYFFTDEAIQTMAAADFLHNSLRGPDGSLLPTYFQNGPYYNLSLSVYLQVPPTLLFGKSVFVTRAVSVLVSLIAAFSAGMILKNYLNLRYWWAGALLLSISPAWFLHSRTAFETVVFVSMYAAFLYAYLLYRCSSPRYIYLALVLAALAFYSYSPGQLVIGVTGVVLLFSDLPYHWQQRSRWLRVGLVAIALALPYMRFRLGNSFDPEQHLRLLNSYWVQDLPFPTKLMRFWTEYSRGLSIRYWFYQEQQDLARHVMKNYGNILIVTLPFYLIGLITALSQLRSPAYRTILVALLCAPLGSALVGIGITRVLVFVVPAALLTGLGLSASLDWLVDRSHTWRKPTWLAIRNPHSWIATGLFFLLSVGNVWMLSDALSNGSLWFTDYGLGGMQYGARQLFPAVTAYYNDHPGIKMIVTPNWANGTDVLARFFLPEVEGISLGSVDGHLYEEKPLDEGTVFVALADEYARVLQSGKFTNILVDQIIPYPDGRPGFYFMRMRYVDSIADILEREREARRELQNVKLMIDGQIVDLNYSMLDMGAPELFFDGDPSSVARSLEANPLVLDLWFDQPRSIEGVSLLIGRTSILVNARLYFSDQEPVEFSASQREADKRELLDLLFDRAYVVQRLRLEISYPDRGEPEHVHVWEVTLR